MGKYYVGPMNVPLTTQRSIPSSNYAGVRAYIVERGLILEPYEVDSKTNEITAIPAFIEQMALKGVVFAFDAISTQKKLLTP